MENFEQKLNIKNENILNDWDHKILLEGGKNLVQKILKEFRGKLPDAIVYPDTSARPLSYLFDPIFVKISEEKGIRKPRSFFMKVGHSDTFTTIFEDNEGRELFYNEVEKMLIEKIETGDTALATHKEYFFKKAEDTSVKRSVEADRASEIEKYNDNLSGRGIIANIAVIDDFSNQGDTRKEINYAFGYEVPYFSVFGNKNEGKVDKDKVGVLIDPDAFPKNPVNDYSTKLSYTLGDQKLTIGVSKKDNIENQYSEVNQNQTEEVRKRIMQLRREMKELGQEIANNF